MGAEIRDLCARSSLEARRARRARITDETYESEAGEDALGGVIGVDHAREARDAMCGGRVARDSARARDSRGRAEGFQTHR